ncbi:MAG: RluA family pseudouridine synthase [Saprospiraceae bacterium]
MGKKAQKNWSHRASGLKKPVPAISYCQRVFPVLGSKTAARKAIDEGRLLVNGKVIQFGELIREGDELQLTGLGLQKARDFEADLEIIFEDDHLLVVNKPGGIAVNGNRNKTVENAVAGNAGISSQTDALPRPIAAHRIDVPTKGLVLLAKTKSALIELGRAFQQNEIKKEYVAVVHGHPPENGKIDRPVQGKSAVTLYHTEVTTDSRVFGHFALVRMHPQTGRTHQLRIHMQRQGHLIVGDKQYAGKQKTILGKGLFLCACALTFRHPASGKEMKFQIDPPARFRKLLQRERDRFKK